MELRPGRAIEWHSCGREIADARRVQGGSRIECRPKPTHGFLTERLKNQTPRSLLAFRSFFGHLPIGTECYWDVGI